VAVHPTDSGQTIDDTNDWNGQKIMQVEHVARCIGVSRLADVTGLDRVGLPVVAAIRPLSRNLTVTFGKGLTRANARMSAVMEAAELYFSERPPSPLIKAAFGELARDTAIDPARLGQIEPGDVTRHSFNWIQGRLLDSNRPILVPWEVVSMDYSVAARKQKRVLNFGATGLAADFAEDRAVLHGLLETIERDAHNSWNHASDDHRAHTLIDLRSVRSPEVLSLMDRIRSANLELLVWDMTSRAGVPCYLAEVFDLAASTPTAYVQGAAASLSAGIAIQKAIAEALQVRLTYISGGRDDLEHRDYGSRYDHVVANRYWVKNNVTALKRVEALDETHFACEQALPEIIRRLENAGCHSVIIVPFTDEKDPLKVVKIIAPRLSDVGDVESSHVLEDTLT
jgi:YcaO-like protein with predicted kinase domain